MESQRWADLPLLGSDDEEDDDVANTYEFLQKIFNV